MTTKTNFLTNVSINKNNEHPKNILRNNIFHTGFIQEKDKTFVFLKTKEKLYKL